MDFEGTPLLEPIPDDPILHIHRLARDLAWGALHSFWSLSSSEDIPYWGRNDGFWQEYLGVVWSNSRVPQAILLKAFGYLHGHPYELTQKAFDLLNKPLSAPTIFISYRRRASSAFGLLLVSRLKAVGVQNPFIDMNIQPGDEWHGQLEAIIRNSRYFILLIGEGTLESDYVQKEIAWALATPNMTIIPILHDELTETALPLELATKQAIVVERESAEYYELAVIKLLNRLGYT